MNKTKINMKRLLTLLLAIQIMMTSVSTFAMNPQNNETYEYSNNDVTVMATLERNNNAVLLSLDATIINDSLEFVGYRTPADSRDTVIQNYEITENGMHEFAYIYLKEGVERELSIPIAVADIQLENPEVATSEYNESSTSTDVQVRDIPDTMGDIVSLTLNANNVSLKDPSDYKFGDPTQANFLVDLNIFPAHINTNREVIVKIPRHFALEKNNLEKLSGTTFKSVEIDYAGYFDVDTNSFIWDDGENTVVKFKLHDVQNDDDNTPIGITFAIYQNTQEIATNGKAPKVDYTFSVSSNMNAFKDSFTFEVPFSDSGFSLNGVDTTNDYVASVNDFNEQVFTIKNSKPIFSSNAALYNNSHPDKIEPLITKFVLAKEPTALPLKSMVIEIPIPKGYIWVNDSHNTLFSSNGGLDYDLNLGMSDPDWLSYNDINNSLILKLDEVRAKGLLQGSNTIGTNAAQLQISLLRVNDDKSIFNRNGGIETQNIPYNLVSGEVQKANAPATYTFEDTQGGKVSSSGRTLVIEHQTNPANYQFQTALTTEVTKTAIDQTLRKMSFNNNSILVNQVYENVEIKYDFSEMHHTKSKVWVSMINKGAPYVDRDATLILEYKDSSGTTKTQDISSASTNNDASRAKEFPIEALNNQFGIDVVQVHSLTYKYKYVIGKGSRGDYAEPSIQISTERRPGSNNDAESFNIKATFSTNGAEIKSYATSYRVNLNPNNYTITSSVAERRTVSAAVGKTFKNPYASGTLTIPAFHEPTTNAHIEISSSENTLDALQFATQMTVSGGSGKVTYQVRNDTTTYEEAYDNDTKAIIFKKVDIARGKTLSHLKVYPDGLDDNTNGKTIMWNLYFNEDRVPLEFFKDGIFVFIPDGTTMPVNAKFVGSDDYLWAQGQGTTITFKVPSVPLTFTTESMNLSAQDKIVLSKTNARTFLNIGMENKGNNGGYAYDYAKQTFDTTNPTKKADVLDMLSLAGSIRLNTNIKTNEQADHHITITYTVYNTESHLERTEVISLTNTEIKNGTMFNFNLKEHEVLSQFEYQTNIFKDYAENGFIAFDFITKDPTPFVSVYGREIRLNESYLIPTKMEGKIVGALSVSDLGNHNAASPQFMKPETSKETIESDLSNTFFAQVLRQDFSAINDPSYAFISKDHDFEKPIISYILHTPRDLADLTDAHFSVKNSLSEDVLSRIGYLRIGGNSDVKPIKGRVEYRVKDTVTGIESTLTRDIKGTQVNEKVDLPISENQVIRDIVIYADNLVNFTTRQRYSFQYFLRDNQGVETFLSDDGAKQIPNAFSSDVIAELSYFNGIKRESISSTVGSTVSFYDVLNRFKILPDTAIPSLAYYQNLDVDSGKILGFSFINYRESQTYTNAKFNFIANGVNAQIFPLTEGIEITNALNDGSVRVTYNDLSEKAFPFKKGDTKRIDLEVSDNKYIKDIQLNFPHLSAGKAPVSGSWMGINFLLLDTLKDQTRDGNIIDPAQSFDLKVKFDADNYDAATGIEDFPSSGEIVGIGETHRLKGLDSALFANYVLPNIPSNYIMNLYTELVGVKDVDVISSRTIYQGNTVEFEHSPRIGWETARINMSPDAAYLDNPKLYYVIDARFEYTNDSFKFYDTKGNLMETSIAHIPSEANDYSIIEVSFIGPGYHLNLEGITSGSRSDVFEMGTATFSLRASRIETGDNIIAVRDSFVDLGNNVSADPDNYIYSHDVRKYTLPAYDFGEYAGKSTQYLPMGKGLSFNIFRNQVIGINNSATTPNQKGDQVHGSEITAFGEELVVSSGIRTMYNTYIYVPIPKQNLTYVVKDKNNTTRNLRSDFSMDLRDQLILKSQSSGTTIAYTTDYAGDAAHDTEYPSQMGLAGNPITETGYESYDTLSKEKYTMLRIHIPVLLPGEYLVFDLPMEYHGIKTSNLSEIARTNLQYTYSVTDGNYGTSINAALDLSYHISELVISGTVWEDLDNNSVHNPNGLDRGMANIKVIASKTVDGQDYTYETLSGADGQYELRLPGGHYKVNFEDRFTNYTYPNKFDFVNANQGSASDYSSKANPNQGPDYGSVDLSVNERNVRFVNAGYYRVLPELEEDALIQDSIIWVNETEPLIYKNPSNLNIDLKNQTLQIEGKNIATIRTNPSRVTGENLGQVHVPYSYPDGKGGSIDKTFKVSVLDTYTVTYDVVEKDGIKNGSLTPSEGYLPPAGLSNLQEQIFDQRDTNRVTRIPEPKGKTSQFVFDGWLLADGTRVDLKTFRITDDITFYASFAKDSNEDGIADKYQIRFEYITQDTIGNGNLNTPNYVEWVTRYVDPSLTGEALTALNNLSETAAVSPQVPQKNPLTRIDYQFSDWNDNTTPMNRYRDGLAITQASFTESEVEFTANYERKKLTVSYQVKDGLGVLTPTNHQELVLYGDQVKDLPQVHGLDTPEFATVFDGWFLEDGSPFDEATYSVEQDITVFAYFAKDENKDGIADKYQVRFEYITEDGLGNGNIGDAPFVEWGVRYVDASLSGDDLNALGNLSETAPVAPKIVQANPKTLTTYEFTGWETLAHGGKHYPDGEAIIKDTFTETNVQFKATYTLKDTKNPEPNKPTPKDPNKPTQPELSVEKGKLPLTGMGTDVVLLFSTLLLALGALLIVLKKEDKR